jgi:hypothetical protein
MPTIEVRTFGDLVDDAREIMATIEHMDRSRRDARTAALIHAARVFVGALEVYQDATGEVATPTTQTLPEALIELANEALEMATEICGTTGGPGSSALVQCAGRLRNGAVVYAQDQRRLAAEVLRQLELPHYDVKALLPSGAVQ